MHFPLYSSFIPIYSNPINYYIKPTAENQSIQSDAVIFKKAILIAFVSIEISLTFLVRKDVFAIFQVLVAYLIECCYLCHKLGYFFR